MSGLMNIMLNIRLISVIDYLRSIHRWLFQNTHEILFTLYCLFNVKIEQAN